MLDKFFDEALNIGHKVTTPKRVTPAIERYLQSYL